MIMINCKADGCEKEFPFNPNVPLKEYCSDKCRKLMNWKKATERNKRKQAAKKVNRNLFSWQ